MAARLGTVAAGLLVLVACRSDYDIGSGPVDVDPGDVTDCGFEPIPGTKMSRYECNPVFTTPSDEEWSNYIFSIGYRAELVLGHAFYQMWYVGDEDGEDGEYGLGHAISGNGVDWEVHEANPLFVEPRNGGWDKSTMQSVAVVYNHDIDQYAMLYHGINYQTSSSQMGMMTSPDGLDWQQTDNSPVLEMAPQSYNGNSYCWPLSFTYNDGEYRGYLTGGRSGSGNTCEIYDFAGPSLDDISLGQEPIVEAGPEWYDQSGMTSAAVVKFEDTYYMFYSGFEYWTDDPNSTFIYATNSRLSMATSEDGETWEKHPGNPIPVDTEEREDGFIGDVAAQVVGDRIHLWITDYYPEEEDSGVGYFYFEPTLEEPHPDPE